MHRVYLYPSWLRLWHWINAVLFLLLIGTGISMHFSGSGDLIIPFKTSMGIHNVSGILLIVMYIFYLIFNLLSGNIKNYIPKLNGILKNTIKQSMYYVSGIFKGEPHPFESVPGNKFNPMQQMTYIFIMFVFFPIIIATGLFLMYPLMAPDDIYGVGGVFFLAFAHSIAGFMLSVFMIGHIYLATTGETPTANLKSMINGWHESSHHHESEEDKIKSAESQI